jgi:hypothetical protein
MVNLSKKKIVWAINETQSMKQAAKLLSVSYNTFKKYAKLYDVFQPAKSLKGIYRSTTTGFKPTELSDIFAGNNPSYSTTKLQHRVIREGYLKEECCNCGEERYRASDMSKPLILDYMDDDSTNKALVNLRLLCFNCFFIMKGQRLEVKQPKNIRQLQKAVGNLFSTE